MKIGIIGMPNVGKSTLFNALLKKQVALAENYPFATIEPNIGVVAVPDERLPKLAEVVADSGQARMTKPPIVPAIVEFYDIAGLVKGASQGEGLGNKFLSHIREVSAITHVVRLFEDRDIIHVANKVEANEDIKIIEEELQLADLQTLDKQREPKGKTSKEEIAVWNTVIKVKGKLNQGVSVRDQGLTDEEKEAIRHLNLLTLKPVIYCFNCSLEQLENNQDTRNKIQTMLQDTRNNNQDANYILFNPLIEETLNVMIKKAYETLNLISFLTAGEKEVRAWTIPTGTLAPQAAGVIHTDFEKNFIKAEIIPYEKFVEVGGWAKGREKGLVQMAGRDYIMRDGDVVDFKIGA